MGTELKTIDEKKTNAVARIKELNEKIESIKNSSEDICEDKEKIPEILEAYEEIESLAFEYDVEYPSVIEYASFLSSIDEGKKAYELEKKLLPICDETEKISFNKKVHLWTIIVSSTFDHPDMYEVSEKYLKEAMEMNKERISKDSYYLPALAFNYIQAVGLYENMNKKEKAELYYTMTIDTYKGLPKENQASELPKMCNFFIKKLITYCKSEDIEKAVYYYEKVIFLNKIIDGDSDLPYSITDYDNISHLYEILKNNEK
jgi:tetratricopeptide (TPR) repeat protein